MILKATSFKPVMTTAQSLADLLLGFDQPCVLVGDFADAVMVNHVAPLDLAQKYAFSFLSSSKLKGLLRESKASVVALARSDYDDLLSEGSVCVETVYVCTPSAYALYAHIAQRLYLNQPFSAGVHASAIVSETAYVDKTAQVAARVVLGESVRVGARVILKSGVVLGDGVSIGDDTVIYPNVTVYDECVIGQRCVIHAGAVIGSDGFGFAPVLSGWKKIAQIGRVLIGNDVEVGANTTIDRGAISDTVIHNDVKIDNQVQIAHNCEIGAHTAIASCVGIAGSAVIGERCTLAGASMIAGHLSIADGTVVSGATVISSSITEPGRYTGAFPTMQHRDWERNASLIRHLSDLRKRLRALEKNN